MLNDSIFILIIVIFFFTAIFFTWFFIHKAKTKERLLLIEKGVELSNIPRRRRFKFPWKKIGIVIVFGAFGVLFGGFLESFNLFKPEESTTPLFEMSILHQNGILSLLFMYLFGGGGMIIAHYLDKKKGNK